MLAAAWFAWTFLVLLFARLFVSVVVRCLALSGWVLRFWVVPFSSLFFPGWLGCVWCTSVPLPGPFVVVLARVLFFGAAVGVWLREGDHLFRWSYFSSLVLLWVVGLSWLVVVGFLCHGFLSRGSLSGVLWVSGSLFFGITCCLYLYLVGYLIFRFGFCHSSFHGSGAAVFRCCSGICVMGVSLGFLLLFWLGTALLFRPRRVFGARPYSCGSGFFW